MTCKNLQKIVDSAFDIAGDPKLVWCEASLGFATKITQRRGISLGGAWSPRFLRSSEERSFEVPFVKTMVVPNILLIEACTSGMADVLPLLEEIAKTGRRLLVITNEIHDEALRTFIVNDVRGTVNICVVRMAEGLMDGASPLGRPLCGLPRNARDLPRGEEVWIRRDSSVMFLDHIDNYAPASHEVTIIEVGGEDFEDQRERLRYVAGMIRSRASADFRA